jgi:hypothetical protein
MAYLATKVLCNDFPALMQSVYDHATNANAAVQLATSLGAGTPAGVRVHDGASGNPAFRAPALDIEWECENAAHAIKGQREFFKDSSYLVVEPKIDYPAVANRWQGIVHTAGSASYPALNVVGAPEGGWDHVDFPHIGFLTPIISSTVNNADAARATDGTTLVRQEAVIRNVVSFPSNVYCISGDVLYDGGTKTYTYFWVLVESTTAGQNRWKGFRLGGYVPVDAGVDTQPWMTLCGIMSTNVATTSKSFGYGTASPTLNFNRINVEFGTPVTQQDATGYCLIVGPDLDGTHGMLNVGKDLTGNYVGLKAYIWDIALKRIIGYLNPDEEAGLCDRAIPEEDTNFPTDTRLKVSDWIFKFIP